MHTIGTNYQEITPKKWRTPKRIARKCQNGAETSNRLLIPNQQFFDKNFYQNTGEKLRRRQRKLMKYKDRLNIPRPELAADKENSRVNRVQRSSRPHPADFLASDMSKWKRDQRIYLSSKSKALLKSRNLWADEDPRARIPLHERSPSNEAAKPRLRKCENYRDVEDLVDEGSLTPGRHNHRENSKKRLFELNKPSLRSKDSKRGGIETDRPDSYFYGSKRSATTRLSNRATNRTLSKERVEQSGSNIYVSKLTNTAEYELHQQYPVSAYGNSVRGSGPGGQGGGNNVNNVNHNTNNVNTNTQSKAFSGLWTSNDYKTPDRRTPQRRVRFSPSPVSERSAPRSRLQSREHSPHRRGLKRGHSFVKTGDNRAMISRLNMAGGNDRQRVRGAQMGQGSPAERAGSPQRSPLMSNLRLNADGYPIEDVCSRKNLNRKAGLPVTQIIRERQEVTIGEPNQPQNEQNPGKGRSALTPVKAVLGRSMRTSRSSNRPSGGGLGVAYMRGSFFPPKKLQRVQSPKFAERRRGGESQETRSPRPAASGRAEKADYAKRSKMRVVSRYRGIDAASEVMGCGMDIIQISKDSVLPAGITLIQKTLPEDFEPDLVDYGDQLQGQSNQSNQTFGGRL